MSSYYFFLLSIFKNYFLSNCQQVNISKWTQYFKDSRGHGEEANAYTNGCYFPPVFKHNGPALIQDIAPIISTIMSLTNGSKEPWERM